MKLKEVIWNIKNNRLPNVTNRKQVSDGSILGFINEAMYTLYTEFLIKKEQAIILVPRFRNTFKIDSSDANVIMGTYERLAVANSKKEDTESGYDKFHLLEDMKDKDTLDEYSYSELALKLEEIKKLETKKEEGILQILSINDLMGTNYNINQENVFAVSQDTLYFPNAKEGNNIYIIYKPKPKIYTEEDYAKEEVELELPDTLLECLYAFIDLRIINTIEAYKEFYPNLMNTYNQEIQKAKQGGYVLPDSMESSLQFKKGFY